MPIISNVRTIAPVLIGFILLVGGLIAFGLFAAGKKKAAELLSLIGIGALAGILLISAADLFMTSGTFSRQGTGFVSTFLTGDICDVLPDVFCQTSPTPSP